MKKIMMMVVAAFMATVNANAQFEAGTFSIQPLVGCGAATITNADNINIAGKDLKNQFTVSAMTGVEAEYQISKAFSVAAGLNYTLQGTGWENYTQGSTKYNDPRMELGYVKIPLVVNCYVAKGLALKAGVQFGFLMKAKQGGEDVKDYFEKSDFSIPVGLSYEFDDAVVELRYNIGVSNIRKDNYVENLFSDGKKIHNSVLMLTFGYRIPLF
jgi:hypothetical protein